LVQIDASPDRLAVLAGLEAFIDTAKGRSRI
jgi:hypothetical protein